MIHNTVISVEQLSKSFRVGEQDVPVLKNISLEVREGDFVIIFGPSGSGKSTLLHSILGLEPPSAGRVTLLGKDIYETKHSVSNTEDELSDFRKRHVGMVYQQANWIKSLTVAENTAFPLRLLGEEKQESLKKATAALVEVGMSNWAGYVPSELSSGQQQKVALARAMITGPELVIADEPTGNLDYDSGQDIMHLLALLNERRNRTVVMVTHDLEYLRFARTAVRMFDGEVAGVYGEHDKEKLMREVRSKRGNGA